MVLTLEQNPDDVFFNWVFHLGKDEVWGEAAMVKQEASEAEIAFSRRTGIGEWFDEAREHFFQLADAFLQFLDLVGKVVVSHEAEERMRPTKGLLEART